MSRFQPGQNKPTGSGRKRGTKNRRTDYLCDALGDLEFDLPKEIVQLLPSLSVDKRADVLLELMSFVFPKRKSIEKFEYQQSVSGVESMTPDQRRERLLKLNQMLNATEGEDGEVRGAAT